MISVIISTYNRPERLKKAIQSVIDQSFTDWELIIVHDGQHYFKDVPNDARITYCDSAPHFGNDTRPKNLGIKQSQGDYIAFLDDDNTFMPDHLRILLKEAERVPNADVIYGDRLVVFEDKSQEPTVGIASDYNPGLLFEHNYIDTSDVLIKREALFLVGGFDERYDKYVDWNLWIRMTKARLNFLHVPKVITYYNIHKDQKSQRVKDEKVGEVPFGRMTPEPVFKPKWDGWELEIVLPYLGEKPAPKVAIYTLTMNRLEYTKIMYESLKKAAYPFTWFVVDNGSTDGTVEWLKSIPDKNVKLIFNKKNKGISLGSNQALDAIGQDYDFIVKLDNDAQVLADKWLSKLLYIFLAHWQLALSPYVEGLIENAGGPPRMGYKQLRGHLIGITPHIGGIFVMTHKSAYKTFRWSKKDFLHGMQDLIFSREIQKQGFLVGYVEDLRVNHIDSSLGQKKKFPEYFKQREYERTHTA